VMHSKRYYDWLGREPAAWRSSALELKRAADAVATQWAQDPTPPHEQTRQRPRRTSVRRTCYWRRSLWKPRESDPDQARSEPLPAHGTGQGCTQDAQPGRARRQDRRPGADRTLVRRLAQFAAWSGRYILSNNGTHDQTRGTHVKCCLGHLELVLRFALCPLGLAR
jgi:hypothetical protein